MTMGLTLLTLLSLQIVVSNLHETTGVKKWRLLYNVWNLMTTGLPLFPGVRGTDKMAMMSNLRTSPKFHKAFLPIPWPLQARDANKLSSHSWKCLFQCHYIHQCQFKLAPNFFQQWFLLQFQSKLSPNPNSCQCQRRWLLCRLLLVYSHLGLRLPNLDSPNLLEIRVYF